VYDVSGLILVGGASRRMGRPKTELRIGGRPLVDRVIAPVAELCRDVMLAARSTVDFLQYEHRVVRDFLPGQGPLGGLAAGLFFSRHPWMLVVACDLPFLQPRLLSHLIERALALPPGPRVAAPQTAEGRQPLVGLYHQSCLPHMRKFLDQGRRKVDELIELGVIWEGVPEAELRAIDPELDSFFNVNTPEDLAEAESRLARS
jgi:molybdopterin-guanine dinucleotide biosynthesis protein A